MLLDGQSAHNLFLFLVCRLGQDSKRQTQPSSYASQICWPAGCNSVWKKRQIRSSFGASGGKAQLGSENGLGKQLVEHGVIEYSVRLRWKLESRESE